ncbi:MAG: hypothetical protein IT168_06045 [Bryobacterales bacterium]|nr:hypothetical protein [Bryobacterales bacterium]
MIVYSDRRRPILPAQAIYQLRRDAERIFQTDREATASLLLELGALEASVLDVEGASRNLVARFDVAMRAAAHLYRGRAADVRPHLDALGRIHLPPVTHSSIAEGFAFYGLYPDTYAEAARDLVADYKPEAAVVIGLRTIGGTLSAVVAAELEACGVTVHRFTLRPHGHPFDRRVYLPGHMHVPPRGIFVIVDEGPGLSGSSFAATVRPLLDLGVAANRIVLFPSWDAHASQLNSQSARAIWTRVGRYHRPFEPRRHARAIPSAAVEVSAGEWRNQVMKGADWPAVQPQHERRKYLMGKTLFKFEGLGPYGREAYQTAVPLSGAGYIPPVQQLADGFLAMEFVDGRPMTPEDLNTDFLHHVADYLNARSTFHGSQEGAAFDELANLIAVNTSEAGLPVPDVSRFRDAIINQQRVAVDGRMMPHEWLLDAGRYWKTDALDHCRDHFYPGMQDIAWDLAGFAIEFKLSREGRAYLHDRYLRRRRDPSLRRREAFYRVAYAAFRLGYTTMAAEALASSNAEEAARFRHDAARYRAEVTAAAEELNERTAYSLR